MPPLDVLPSLGDNHDIPGLGLGVGRARTRLVVGADLAVPVPLEAFFRVRLRGGVASDRANDWIDGEEWLGGAAAELFLHTVLGQIIVGWGAATSGERRFEVQLGAAF
jgi:hypothetical protein